MAPCNAFPTVQRHQALLRAIAVTFFFFFGWTIQRSNSDLLSLESIHESGLILQRESNSLDTAKSSECFTYPIQNSLLVSGYCSACTVAVSQVGGGGSREAVRLCGGWIHLTLGDPNANAGCRSRKKIPQELEPSSRYRSRDVGGRVSDANREYVHVWRALKDTRT